MGAFRTTLHQTLLEPLLLCLPLPLQFFSHMKFKVKVLDTLFGLREKKTMGVLKERRTDKWTETGQERVDETIAIERRSEYHQHLDSVLRLLLP